ncbi:MAG: hypothetical protein Q8M26_13030 [Pseudolabrys sp.]|nr:hypothetical protein [Pseudolabrys sp.]
MADKRKTPDAAEAARRAKRAATIDLTATEVKPANGPESKAAPKPAPKPDGDPPIWQPPADEPKPEPIQEPPSDLPPAAPPPVDDPPPAIDEPPPSEKMAGPGPADDTPARAAEPARRPILPVIAAGCAGGAVMAIILSTFWFAGLLPVPQSSAPSAPNGTQVASQVAALEKQVIDLQSRPAPAIDNSAIDALGQRLAKIESAVATLPAGDSGAAEKLAAADNAVKSLGVALAALTKRSEDTAANVAAARQRAEAAEKAVSDLRAGLTDVAKTAEASVPSADVDALQKRIDTLEQAVKESRSQVASLATTSAAADTSARLALSATALHSAVVSGAPFAPALAQVKALGADPKAVAPLEPFAATGIPSPAALTADLRAALPAMAKASSPPPATGGFLEKLEANASRLVRIRPVDAPSGDDSSAVLARIETAAAKADIAAALTELGKLDAAARAPAQSFIDKANARQAALAAARQLVADSSLALGQK